MDTATFLLIAMISGAVAGAFMGLFPLILGWMFDYKKLAGIGFIACLVAGPILGIILAAPIALSFTVYIAKQIKSERKSKIEAYNF